MLLRLACCLNTLGWQKYGAKGKRKEDSEYIFDDTEYNAQNPCWQEAITVYEKLMKMNLTAEQRGTAAITMIPLLKRTGRYDRAKEVARAQASLLYCKEILLPRTAEGEEQDRYQGETIIALLHQLYAVVVNSIVVKPSVNTTAYCRSVLLSLADLFEKIFYDGRCGDQHEILSYIYLLLANCEANYGDDVK